jgi:hypothetical protein
MITPALAESSDRAEVAAASAASIVPPPARLRSRPRSIWARSAWLGSAICMIPSTNRRRPISVGMRPALVGRRAGRHPAIPEAPSGSRPAKG